MSRARTQSESPPTELRKKALYKIKFFLPSLALRQISSLHLDGTESSHYDNVIMPLGFQIFLSQPASGHVFKFCILL